MSRVRSFLWFVGLFIISLVSAVVLLKVFGGEEAGQEVAFLESIKTPLLIMRIVVVALLVLFWPMLMNRAAKRNDWQDDQLAAATHFRWKILFWYVVLELFIVQNIIGKFIDWVA